MRYLYSSRHHFCRTLLILFFICSVRRAAVRGQRERLPLRNHVGSELCDDNAHGAPGPRHRLVQNEAAANRLAILAGLADARPGEELARAGRVEAPAQRLQDDPAGAAHAPARGGRGARARRRRAQRLAPLARRLPALRVARPLLALALALRLARLQEAALALRLARPQPRAAQAARHQEHGEPRPLGAAAGQVRRRGEQAPHRRRRRAAPPPHRLARPQAARHQAQAHLVAPHHHGAQRAQPAAAEGPQRRPAGGVAARPHSLSALDCCSQLYVRISTSI